MSFWLPVPVFRDASMPRIAPSLSVVPLVPSAAVAPWAFKKIARRSAGSLADSWWGRRYIV